METPCKGQASGGGGEVLSPKTVMSPGGSLQLLGLSAASSMEFSSPKHSMRGARLPSSETDDTPKKGDYSPYAAAGKAGNAAERPRRIPEEPTASQEHEQRSVRGRERSRREEHRARGEDRHEASNRAPSIDSSAPTVNGKNNSLLLSGRWRVEHTLGKGSFGTIKLGVDVNTLEEVAIKFEPRAQSSQLVREKRLYSILDGDPGFPRMLAFGENETHRFIVMERVGPSLEDLLTACGHKLSVTVVMQLADGILSRVEDLHSHGIVHRDVKPDNFCLGIGDGDGGRMYAVDFGLSKQFLDPRTRQHIEGRAHPIKDIIGTARYCSLNSHAGTQLARRDDLESVAYVLVYLACAGLPWQASRFTRQPSPSPRPPLAVRPASPPLVAL